MKVLSLVIASVFAVNAVAFAQEETRAGTQKSVAAAADAPERTLRNTNLAVSPQLGLIGYNDNFGNYTTRGAAGIGVDLNLIPMISPKSNDFYGGLSSGGFYSHVGATTSNFFGTNPDTGAESKGSLVLIPMDAKLGYNMTTRARISVHGGANVIYRSIGNSVDLGTSSSSTAQTSDSNWSIFPNAGLDLEVGIGKNIALIARPDFTFADSGNRFFTGMVGVTAMAL